MPQFRAFGHYLNLPLVMLSLMDVVVVGVILYWVVAHSGRVPTGGDFGLLAAFSAATAFFTTAAVGLYHMQLRVRLPGILVRTVVAFLLGVPAFVAVAVLAPLPLSEVALALAVGAMAYGIVGLLHSVFFALADAGVLRRRVLVLGSEESAMLAQMRRRSDRRGFEIVGFIQPPGAADREQAGRESLCQLAWRLRADEIVVAVKDRRGVLPVRELLECKLCGMEVVEVADFVERESGRVRIDLLKPAGIVFGATHHGAAQAFIKRTVDLVVASLLLLATLPVTLGTIIAIKRAEGWGVPVFYRQVRVGKGGAPFALIKFRSMRQDAEADGRARWAAKDDDRVTKVGKWIRKLRIDELPQLLNVLRGEMSLVGPRPERPAFVEELERHIPYYELRHRIKPGVTGWAQLLYPYGSSRADAAEKLQFDLYYLKNRSLLLDLMILLQTVEVVLFGKGAR